MDKTKKKSLVETAPTWTVFAAYFPVGNGPDQPTCCRSTSKFRGAPAFGVLESGPTPCLQCLLGRRDGRLAQLARLLEGKNIVLDFRYISPVTLAGIQFVSGSPRSWLASEKMQSFD